MREPLKLFVLGSCRVHRPIRLLQEQGRALLCTAGIPGYIHSTREARQRLRWLSEGQGLDRQLLPFLFARSVLPRLEETHRRELAQADVVVIEAAAERSVEVDGVFLQKNLVVRHLVRELGEPGMQWWRGLIRSGSVHPDDYARAMGEYRQLAEPALLASGERVLRRARCALDSEQAVRDDLQYAARLIGKPVVAVTHVDLPRPDGRLMVSRSQHVARVKAAAAALPGVHVIDPLDCARDMTREQVLDRDGEDLNHYCPAFEAVLAEHLHQQLHAAARIGSRKSPTHSES
ncbi:capsular biosynthesis protein [Bordetella genomosp. 12]|uniref:Capsular biosynthesis protein n=1 Tax=Bordetella genomosp. 12 TaxID=463035 RepID=A0A261VP06_9BORD|nr:capsular biosynthesis protein [Bordetella genomosp. 12]OZI74933.1 capsular biosynthesis protein [Bordetella genomosp. 12]